KRTYIRGMVPDPLDRFLIMVLKVVEKKIDRYEVGAPKMVVYDLKEHKIARTIPWPNNEERENVNVMFSPDGKLLYFFADDVLIYDTTDFKQIDTWELSRRIASAPTDCCRRSAATSSGRSISTATTWPRPNSTVVRGWHCGRAPTAKSCTSIKPATRSTSTTPRTTSTFAP